MNWNDWKGLITLTCLYYYQGLALGFPMGGIQIILAERHVPYALIGLMTFTPIPFSFKSLWAPFLDYYFFESVGKRKTYIIPCLLLTSIFYFILAS
jgi:hypothetical protein